MSTPKDPPTFLERFFAFPTGGKERTQQDYALVDHDKDAPPLRLRDRRLELGRGRVYPMPCHCHWSADYRDLEGSVYGAYAEDIADAHNWIRTKAMEATK